MTIGIVLGVDDLDAALAETDLAVIVTAHPGIDHHRIAATVPTVDLRGVTRKIATQELV